MKWSGQGAILRTVQSERDHSKIERARALEARKRFQQEKKRSQAAKKGWETRKTDLGQFEKMRAAAVRTLTKFVESGSTDKKAYSRYRSLVRAMYEAWPSIMTLEERVEVRWHEYVIITEKNRIEVEAGFAAPPGVGTAKEEEAATPKKLKAPETDVSIT